MEGSLYVSNIKSLQKPIKNSRNWLMDDLWKGLICDWKKSPIFRCLLFELSKKKTKTVTHFKLKSNP